MITKEDKEFLEDFEEFEKEYLERAETHRRKIDFTKGIALGLLYGIIGNLFVQFFYSVVEGIILQKFDVLFWSNLVISAIALSIIILATLSFRSQLSWSQHVMEGDREGANHLRGIINERKAKLRNGTESRNTC
jgi:H+/Cl- antiporter ClcA